MNAKKRKKISSSTYKKRSYRQAIVAPAGLISNFVTVQETDLHIMAPVADAAATRLGNEVSSAGKENINYALEVARSIPDLLGVVIICGEQMGAWGEIDLVGLD